MFILVQFGPLDHNCGTTYDVVFDEQDEPYTLKQFVEEAQVVHNHNVTTVNVATNGCVSSCFYYNKIHPEHNRDIGNKILDNCRVVRAGAYQLSNIMQFGVIIELPQ